jgi:hypothetical protein
MIRLALGLMPMQLLNLGPLLSLATARAFWTKTPRGAFSVHLIHSAQLVLFLLVYIPTLVLGLSRLHT